MYYQASYVCGEMELNPAGREGESRIHEEFSLRVILPSDEEAGLFIHQLWLILDWRLLPRGVNSPSLPAFHT